MAVFNVTRTFMCNKAEKKSNRKRKKTFFYPRPVPINEGYSLKLRN